MYLPNYEDGSIVNLMSSIKKSLGGKHPYKELKVLSSKDIKGSKNVVLLDNNILALPEHFKLICKQAKDNKIKLDFNQGLDCRLLTEDMVSMLKDIKATNLHFAWDDLKYENDVKRSIDLLQKRGINRCKR